MTTNQKYGWWPSLPDFRDYPYQPVGFQPLNGFETLQDKMTPVLNQGQLGSCVGNTVADVMLYTEQVEGHPNPELLSRLQIYYEGRKLEGTITSDSGLVIRDAMKVVFKVGAAAERVWPYDVTKFKQKPPTSAYRLANVKKAKAYFSLDASKADRLTCIRSAIYEGLPVIFGMTLYESFESAEVTTTGKVPMPQKTEGILGGHCMHIIGVDMDQGTFQVRNQWGQWGDGGNCWIPIDYLINPQLASDFWVIKTVS